MRQWLKRTTYDTSPGHRAMPFFLSFFLSFFGLRSNFNKVKTPDAAQITNGIKIKIAYAMLMLMTGI